MLSTPEAGWCNLTIGLWSDRCSYLDDVPVKLLNIFLVLYKDGILHICDFDAEGWENHIVFNKMITEITSNKDNGYDTTIYISSEVLAKELISDIRRDIDKWVIWDFNSDNDLTDEQKEKRKQKLLNMCNELESYLNLK